MACFFASLVRHFIHLHFRIEHLHEPILQQVPEAIFGRLHPSLVVLTTPNVEFNVLFGRDTGFRHYDHKFEWTRQQFRHW